MFQNIDVAKTPWNLANNLFSFLLFTPMCKPHISKAHGTISSTLLVKSTHSYNTLIVDDCEMQS